MQLQEDCHSLAGRSQEGWYEGSPRTDWFNGYSEMENFLNRAIGLSAQNYICC